MSSNEFGSVILALGQKIILFKNLMESLILAQDECWRCA